MACNGAPSPPQPLTAPRAAHALRPSTPNRWPCKQPPTKHCSVRSTSRRAPSTAPTYANQSSSSCPAPRPRRTCRRAGRPGGAPTKASPVTTFAGCSA
eukprot:scaffold24415_cov46-Phaeocystis_antarctica.AAC.1